MKKITSIITLIRNKAYGYIIWFILFLSIKFHKNKGTTIKEIFYKLNKSLAILYKNIIPNLINTLFE